MSPHNHAPVTDVPPFINPCREVSNGAQLFMCVVRIDSETAATEDLTDSAAAACNEWGRKVKAPTRCQNASRTAVSRLVGSAVCNSENVRVASG